MPLGELALGLDALTAWFAVIILGIAALAAVYAARYLTPYAGRRHLGAHWLFYNLLVAAMLVVVTARNGVLFLVAWEVMSLASYFLVVFDHEEAQVRNAGRIYLAATHAGTAFLLVLFLLLGQRAGSLDFGDLAALPAPAPGLAAVAFLLAVIGFGTKAGFVPMHV